MAGDEVSRNLARFINKTLDSTYIHGALLDACSLVQEAAVSKAPHDTGNLQRSIHIDVDDDTNTGYVYSDAEYAPYVEVGTGIHSKRGDGRKTYWRYKGRDGWVTTYGNKPQPFLEPAALENQGEIAKMFEGRF